jgi:hypothetical protein
MTGQGNLSFRVDIQEGILPVLGLRIVLGNALVLPGRVGYYSV